MRTAHSQHNTPAGDAKRDEEEEEGEEHGPGLPSRVAVAAEGAEDSGELGWPWQRLLPATCGSLPKGPTAAMELPAAVLLDPLGPPRSRLEGSSG